jgi:hypothetical protein
MIDQRTYYAGLAMKAFIEFNGKSAQYTTPVELKQIASVSNKLADIMIEKGREGKEVD